MVRNNWPHTLLSVSLNYREDRGHSGTQLIPRYCTYLGSCCLINCTSVSLNHNMEAIMKLFSLEGQTALVTGGTRGIGQAMAIALAEAGADIILAQVRTIHQINTPSFQIIIPPLVAHSENLTKETCSATPPTQSQKLKSNPWAAIAPFTPSISPLPPPSLP